MYEVAGWSGEEWKAFAAFTFVWVAEVTVFAIMGLRVTVRFCTSWESSLLVSFLVALAFSFVGLRNMTASFFPKTIAKGDDAAAARLSGKVYLLTNESRIAWSWWWTDPPPVSGTKSQSKARLAPVGVSLLIFLPTFFVFAHVLQSSGASERMAALISLLIMLPIAIFVGRSISVSLWPEIIRAGDHDAIAEENRAVPPRI